MVLPISFLSDGSSDTSPFQVDLSTFLLKNRLYFSVAVKLEGALVGSSQNYFTVLIQLDNLTTEYLITNLQ